MVLLTQTGFPLLNVGNMELPSTMNISKKNIRTKILATYITSTVKATVKIVLDSALFIAITSNCR